MTVIISGTNGVTSVNGSAAAPSVTGTDTDTGIVYGTNTITLATNGTAGLIQDASQNVGIGAAPLGWSGSKSLTLLTPSGSVYTSLFTVGNTVGLTSNAYYNGTNWIYGINYNAQQYYMGDGAHIWRTASASTGTISWSESMRINSSGNLLVGTTSSLSRLTVSSPSNGNGAAYIASSSASDLSNAALVLAKYDNNTTTSQVLVRFIVNNGNTAQGQINANGASAAAFGSWSDQRLKENIVELPSQLSNIMALRPVEFDYIESEGGGHQIGFIAQEVQEIYPDLVGERSDGMLTLTDLNKNDARLIKAIQEQQALITTLTERIAALEQA